MSPAPPSVLFLGSGFAGHRTRFLNLKAHAEHDERMRPRFRLVSGWQDGGVIERLPVLSRGAKGRVRTVVEASAFAGLPRPDAIWTAAGTALTPYLWSQVGPLRRPLVLDFDWTVEQREAWAPLYVGRSPRSGLRRALALLQERALWSRVAMFTSWSQWAAKPVLASGIDPARVRVIPPGVDLDAWATRRSADAGDRPLRLLFVGGDFERKGGDLLVKIVRESFQDRCEVDIVTHAQVEPGPGVRVHSATPNSPELRELYARADLFVLPTRADCFGIATVEAMASGLPVLVSDVGAAREIVDEGDTGWLIQPNLESLRAALNHAVERRECLPAMGRRARAVAEQRFDGRRNDRMVIDVMIEEIEAARGR